MADAARIKGIAASLHEVLPLVVERCTSNVGTFQLGLRSLTVFAEPNAPHIPREGSLLKARGTAEGYPLYLLGPTDLPELRWLTSLPLAAYGFARDLQAVGWLVAIEPKQLSLLALHRESRQGFFISSGDISPRHHAEFARGLAHWHAILDGNLLLHAGAVSHNGRVGLLLGRGGSGKTTLAIHCALSGWQFLGDNVVEIRQDQSGVVAALVYPTAKIRRGSIQFPQLGEGQFDPENEKDIYFLENSGISLGSGDPQPVSYCALLTPETLANGRKVPLGDSLLMTGPDNIAQFPGLEREVLAQLSRLMSAMPVQYLTRAPLPHLEAYLRLMLETRP